MWICESFITIYSRRLHCGCAWPDFQRRRLALHSETNSMHMPRFGYSSWLMYSIIIYFCDSKTTVYPIKSLIITKKVHSFAVLIFVFLLPLFLLVCSWKASMIECLLAANHVYWLRARMRLWKLRWWALNKRITISRIDRQSKLPQHKYNVHRVHEKNCNPVGCIRCHNSGKQRQIWTKFYNNTDTLNGKQVTNKFQ